VRFHNVDLNLLVIIDALLAEGNVSHAAVRLNVSQPAVSNALGRLREHFGDELFVAVGRRMVPTELAQRLAGPVRQILEQSQTVIQERSGFDPTSSDRRFYVAVSDYEGSVFMPEVAGHLATVAPGIRLSLRLSISHAQHSLPQVTEILEQRYNDFVVLPERLGSPHHPREWLFEEQYLCIAWSENYQIGESLTLEKYFELQHVVAEFADNRAPSFDADALEQPDNVRKVAVAVEQFTLIPEYIVGTQRIATIHAALARKFAQRFPLKLYQVPLAIPLLPIIAQWNRVRETDPGMQWFLSQLRSVAARFTQQCLLHLAPVAASASTGALPE
jgi:LysR family nod box-dependent transcriptional activator